MRVALFGGSFDPPHRGHVALARLARERLSLDCVMVAPVAAQPLKQEQPLARFADRVAMAAIAFAGEPRTEISLLDAPRADGKSNYTVDTLRMLRERLDEGDTLSCILGADALLSIRKWHKPDELLASCDFIVGARPGFELSNVSSALPAGVSTRTLWSQYPHTQLIELYGPTGHLSQLYLLNDLEEDISATQVRAAIHDQSNTGEVLDPAVLEYIRAHRLYAASIE